MAQPRDSAYGSLGQCSEGIAQHDRQDKDPNSHGNHGRKNDPLIPNQQLMDQTWDQAEATWQKHAANADKWPAGLFNPLMLLANVPSLPPYVPKDLRGRPEWQVSTPDGLDSMEQGADVGFHTDVPTQCSITFDTSSSSYASLGGANEFTNGFTVLVLCWSYILSATLCERQGQTMKYENTDSHIQPTVADEVDDHQMGVALHADASPDFIRWICALLTPGTAWVSYRRRRSSKRRSWPPWDLTLTEAANVYVVSNQALEGIESIRAPSSEKATKLIYELCLLHKLYSGSSQSSVPVIEAAFLASLAIPHHRLVEYKIELPRPFLRSYHDTLGLLDPSSPMEALWRYCTYRTYFINISIRQHLYYGILWSVFRQPGIPSTLVSSWLGGTASILSRIVEQRDVGQLLRTFASWRPRVALFWIGAFLLGDRDTLLRNVNIYLHSFYTLEVLRSVDHITRPWTGCTTSFWDHEFDDNGDYIKPRTMINEDGVTVPLPEGYFPRSEVLQRRYNSRLGIKFDKFCSWEPISSPIRGVDLEPEMDMGARLYRRYVRWRWDGTGHTDRGFRYNHPDEQITILPDDLELVPPNKLECKGQGKSRPTVMALSAEATQSMTFCCSMGIDGETHVERAAIAGLTVEHPWVNEYWIDDGPFDGVPRIVLTMPPE